MTVNARQKLIKTFTIDYLSQVDDVRYKGSFTTKKLSIRDLASLGVRKSQLNGGMHHDNMNPGRGVSAETDDFNNMVAHLEISLKEAPKWWNLDELNDLNLVALVYKEVIDFEHSFLRRVEQDEVSGGDGEGSGSGSVPEADSEGVLGAVVVKKVPTALEP